MNDMKLSNFYSLGDKLSRATFQAHLTNLNFEEDEKGFDDVVRLLIGDYQSIDFPVEFRQVYGEKLDDIVRTGHAILFLISDKMKAVLEDNNLTGWKTFAVKILSKQGQEIQGYHGLSSYRQVWQDRLR